MKRLVVLISIAASLAQAHTGEALQPHDLWTAWSLEPGVVLPLALSALLYARGARFSRGVTLTRVLLFWAGWAILTLALLSPLHSLGQALFSAHMIQHEILMLVAAPLLVVSRPLVPLLWGLPPAWRPAVGRLSKQELIQRPWNAITAPVFAWLIHAAALWLWHAPALFEATLRSEWMHAAQHASFFLSALLFWWSLFYARGGGYGAAVIYIFTTAAHTSILGALLTFAPMIVYHAYAASAATWGLSPLEDQQIGGLIMWVPAGVIYLAVGLALFAAWLRESEAMIEGGGTHALDSR